MVRRCTSAYFIVFIICFFWLNNTSFASSISGTVSYEGARTERTKIDMSIDERCKEITGNNALSESVLVGENGELKNVFVFIKSGLGERKFDIPKDPAIIDQVGCMFSPRVVGVMIRQSVIIKNSDDFLHNVRSFPKKSRSFNNAIPNKGLTIVKKFTFAEIVPIRCDVHTWMKAYIGVLNNPFHSVTSENGHYKLEDVPSGVYEIEVWHEEFGVDSIDIEINDNEDKTLNYVFR